MYFRVERRRRLNNSNQYMPRDESSTDFSFKVDIPIGSDTNTLRTLLANHITNHDNELQRQQLDDNKAPNSVEVVAMRPSPQQITLFPPSPAFCQSVRIFLCSFPFPFLDSFSLFKPVDKSVM
jgi:hypothetical protein